jgi:hypothetical protein
MSRQMTLSIAIATAVGMFAGVGTSAADPANACTLGGTAFSPKYAVRTNDSPTEININVFDIAPKTAAEKHDACAHSSPAFTKAAGGRSIGVWAETSAKLESGNVVFHFKKGDDTQNDMATVHKVELTGKDKTQHVHITATFNAGSCTVDLPVVACE